MQRARTSRRALRLEVLKSRRLGKGEIRKINDHASLRNYGGAFRLVEAETRAHATSARPSGQARLARSGTYLTPRLSERAEGPGPSLRCRVSAGGERNDRTFIPAVPVALFRMGFHSPKSAHQAFARRVATSFA